MQHQESLPQQCATCPVRSHGAPVCWRELQAQRALLEARGVPRRLAPGEVLYRQGDPARGWWLVRRGQVVEYVVDRAGREQIVRIAPAGCVCGLSGLGSTSAHWATARAGRRGADVCFVSREGAERLAEENPAIFRALMAGLAEEIRMAYHMLHGLSMLPTRSAIAQVLLSAAECTDRGESVITLSRSEIASMVGVAPETVVRVLGEFRAAGLIGDRGRSRIMLLDPCGLHAVAEGLEGG